MTDVFRQTREMVSAQDAARRYGVEINRYGKARCPFHMEKTPSMSFRGGRFKCFGCGVAGDSIDFTGKLLGLEPLAAVERLNADFMLGLPLHRKPTPVETEAARRRKEVAEVHKRFEEWRETLCVKACEAYRVAHIALQRIEAPEDMDKLSARETLAIQWQSVFEHWADVLSYGTMEERMEIFRERQVIQLRLDQILNDMPMKSNVA